MFRLTGTGLGHLNTKCDAKFAGIAHRPSTDSDYKFFYSVACAFAALLFSFPSNTHAQSSPLTVQPSTGRVGVGITNPGYTLDVSGTVNATSFRGDGSQLSNVAAAVLNKVTTDVTVTGFSTTEVVLYSFTVPANTLGTNNRLRLVIQGEHTSFWGDYPDTYTVRVKYGGTTLITWAGLSGPDLYFSGVGAYRMEVLLSADGATNSQLATLNFNGGVAQGTSAVNSTADQTLQVTACWDTCGYGTLQSTDVTRLKHAVLEVLK